MDIQELQEISISEEEIDEIYDQGKAAVRILVLSLVDSINTLTSIAKEQDLRIKKLEDQLAKNSRNSSKPPSSDSPFKNKKKKPQKPRKAQSRKGTTLCQVSDPDNIITRKVLVCEHCHCDLSNEEVMEIDRRQVVDIPPVTAIVTEYQGEVKECPHCHKISRATFPDGVTHKAQYGSKVQAVAVYLRNYQLIPTERTASLFKDLFGISISEGSLVNMTTRCADRLAGFMERVKQKLTSSEVMHNDETGINIGGKLHWLHTAGNQDDTYLSPHKKRGSDAFDEIGILPAFKSVAVHDFWKPYEKYDCTHAYCNAHLLRELTFVHENLKQKWAGLMIKLLLDIKREVDTSEDCQLEEDRAADFRQRYKDIIKDGYRVNPPPEKTGKPGRPKKGKALCLIERLDHHKDEILRFMTESAVPFDNNLAERDLRMVKVRQKISGTFRNLVCAENYCRVRSYISTVRKQGKDIFSALNGIFEPDFEQKILLDS